MSDRYHQKYGPIQRRRASGELSQEPTPPPQRPERPERPERPSRPRSHGGRLISAVLIVIFGVVTALIAPYASRVFANNQALDNVSIQGEPVARMSGEAILQRLNDRYAAFQKNPITLEFENKRWTPSLAELGITLDLRRTTESALGVGRSGDPMVRTNQIWQTWQGGVDIGPIFAVDAAQLYQYLGSLAPAIETPPQDAALSLEAGKVLPTPSQAGRQLLLEETATDILRAIQQMSPQTVAIRTRSLNPRLDDQAAAPAITQARSLLKQTLTLTRGEQIIRWQAEDIAELLRVDARQGQMQVIIDPARLERAVERLAQQVNSPTAEPRLDFRNGAVAIVEPGTIGWRLKLAEAAAAISNTLQSEQRILALPVEEIQPKVTEATLSELGIVELVGEGVSSFAGSAPYRITNIRAGAARMNGVLIAPGEEFSFNTQLGAVDESNGFVQGYAVIGNRTQLEWGGGVCQDSTTLFRAAFWAGLPITERHAHPFYISWYDAYAFPDQAGPGMDATIYTGVQDFKFVNDTNHWLLIKTVVDESNAILKMQLYGTRPNRTVEIRGPVIDNMVPPPSTPVYINDPTLPSGTLKQTDTARRGMDIAVYRIISDNGVPREPELFFTRFKAWPDVFVRGTKP